MSEEVPELPPEVKLEMVVPSLWSFLFASWAKAIEKYPGDSFSVRYEKWLDDVMPVVEPLIGSGTKAIIENFKFPGNDCTTVAKAHQIFVDVQGFAPKIIEMSPEKAVVHETKCPEMEVAKNILPQYLDLPVEKMTCTAADTVLAKTVNPNITFRHGETMCKGGKVCEHIWELKR